jgi:very-short-patch-repair endonuclease
VVDFYCPQVRMAVEVDGDSHYTDEGRAYNTVRDEYLKNCNIFVIRFTNDEVMGNVEGVLDQIASYTSHLTRPATSGRPLLSKER